MSIRAMAAPDGISPATAAGGGPPPGGPGGGASGLTQFVLIHKQGEVWIKFSCPCGQRLLFPTHKPDRVGRCGRCGREHRMVGLEKRIASFERHLQAAAEARNRPDEGLLTRLLRPSQYADAAPPELGGSPESGGSGQSSTSETHPVSVPPPDDFEAFYQGLKQPVHDEVPAAAVPARGSGPAASHLTTAPVIREEGQAGRKTGVSAEETAEVPMPPPSLKRAAASPAPVGHAEGPANPAETGMLTDFDLAPMEPLSSARVRETADIAADRLRPRASQVASQPSGLIWAWPPATAFARSLAATVDLLIPALGAIVAAVLARQSDAGVLARLGWVYGVLCGLGMAWDLAGLLWGAPVSPGKRLAGIHVRQETGVLPSLPVAVARSAVKWLASPLIWPLAMVDVSGRALHDRICRTRVLFGRPREG